jgi:hypothetical protein
MCTTLQRVRIIAIGMNGHFGGSNLSNLHLDLVILHPTVWLDADQLVVDGVLKE